MSARWLNEALLSHMPPLRTIIWHLPPDKSVFVRAMGFR